MLRELKVRKLWMFVFVCNAHTQPYIVSAQNRMKFCQIPLCHSALSSPRHTRRLPHCCATGSVFINTDSLFYSCGIFWLHKLNVMHTHKQTHMGNVYASGISAALGVSAATCEIKYEVLQVKVLKTFACILPLMRWHKLCILDNSFAWRYLQSSSKSQISLNTKFCFETKILINYS